MYKENLVILICHKSIKKRSLESAACKAILQST